MPGAVTKARPGRPPLELEFGARNDAETRALGQAETLLDKDHQVAQAASIFRRYRSVEAQLGAAFASWQGPSSLGAVKKLAAAHANDPAALLNLGWADYQAGRNADAAAAWRRTALRFPDSPYGVDAEDALHGGPAGLPPIVTGLDLPKAIANLPAAAQIAALKRAAAARSLKAKLLYGTTLWNYLRMPLSAERQFAAAARLAPHDPLARAAAAVALFSKAHPTRAFARLGRSPPSSRTPRRSSSTSASSSSTSARTARRRSTWGPPSDGPRSPYAKPARTLLASLARTRSK